MTAYLEGHLAPVPDEIESFDLPVTGALPPELTGRYLRNGPNPRPGADPGHWFGGDGMLHGIRLRGGRAEWYRNRWVRTGQLAGERRFRPDGTLDMSVHSANTHIVGHADRLLALCEAGLPYEVTGELDTLGPHDFGGKLLTPMTAHPKQDPVSGKLYFFGYSFQPPFLTYHRLSAAGELERSVEVDLPAPIMMHDFAITERHVVWLDLPLTFDLGLVGSGIPFRWNDEHPTRLGVMDRDGGTRVQWFEIDPCFVFHVGNAHEDAAGRIVLDAVRYSRTAFRSVWSGMSGSAAESGDSGGSLHRWTLDPATGVAREQALDDLAVEFPTINEDRVGLGHRYVYAAGGSGSVVKYDTRSGSPAVHDLAPHQVAGEAVFVPSGGGEDEGWLLSVVTDTAADSSELLVLDATSVEPVASVALPRRVPSGFHGSWIGDTE
ncbi:carotenoid oxygenase family protein [Saccharopolyspora taberi]|uniref:Dioxygenase n=1 Tax=Saccharopolyspora taberi TaxID=60895 RepID=A0ABN3V620_9PSEU